MKSERVIQPTEQTQRHLPFLNHEILEERKGMESNPDMYTTQIFPVNFLEGTTSIEENLSLLASGFVDFRNTAPVEDQSGIQSETDTENKNVVWIGHDHQQIATEGAKFPLDLAMKDYLIGIKTTYDKDRQRLIVLRDAVGQSCDRTGEQMAEVLDAAEVALNRDIIEGNAELQKRFFLRRYGLAQGILQERNTLSEVKVPELLKIKEEKSELRDLALLSEIDGSIFNDPNEIDLLEKKIVELLPHMKQTDRASIRIPFRIQANGENRDDIDAIEIKIADFSRQFEKSYPNTACEVVLTRSAFHRKNRPDESYGYILVIPVFN